MATWSYNGNDTAEDSAGNVLAGRIFTIWTAETSGSQLTSTIRTWGGSTVTAGQVASESDGRIRFKETSGIYPVLWMKAPDNSMYPVYALEAIGAGTGGVSLSAANTWTGAQNFSAGASVPDDTWAIADTAGLTTALASAGKPVFRGSAANSAARLALSSAVQGDWCIQTDENARYDLTGTTYSNSADWTKNPAGINYTTIPAGSVLYATKGNARPTSRTDVMVIWIGTGTGAPSGWLAGDLTIQQS